MNNFLIGFLGSVAAVIFVYSVRYQIGTILNIIFYKYFPNVSGKYLWTSIEEGDAYPNQKVYLHLKQFAYFVKGYCEVFSGEELKREYSVKGTISQTRILRITFESKTTEHHDFGVGLFRIDSEGKNLKGYRVTLCVICEDTITVLTVLKKL